jgi:hypothetical protein
MSAVNHGNPVRAAAFKAKVHAYLNSQTKSVRTWEILDALAPAIAELGITKAGAYYHIKTMADNGLIRSVNEGRDRQYLAGNSGELATVERPKRKKHDDITPLEQVPHRAPQHHQHAGPPPQVVELEVAGVIVLVGRNPVTGRPRIVIEG